MTSRGDVPSDHRDLMPHAHTAYNAQDVEALLAHFGDDVVWADGEGRLLGEEEVRR